MNRVGQIIQMDGTGVTTCLIVGRNPSQWPDLWDWVMVVIDHQSHPNFASIPDAGHKVGCELHLNNQYIAKYSTEVT